MNGSTIGGRTKAPWHLWLIGIVTLLFNAMGVFSYIMTRLGKLAELGMTPEQIAFMDSYPAWAVTLWAFGVLGAFAGSVLLLLRSRMAVVAMAVALVGLIGTTIYNYGIADVPDSMQAPAFDVAIWLVTLFLLAYSTSLAKSGVLK